MQKRLLLVRHGQTSANIEQVWHGSTDTALTEQGEQQRQALAKNFAQYMDKPDYIVASPLQRARLTAEAVAANHGLAVEHNVDLQEYCLGDWEGFGFDKLMGEFNLLAAIDGDEHFRSPGGESRHIVTTRTVKTIEAAWQSDAQNVVVVGHGLAFAFAMAHLVSGDSLNWQEFMMDNTAVTDIDVGAKTILNFNQTKHLGADFEPRKFAVR